MRRATALAFSAVVLPSVLALGACTSSSSGASNPAPTSAAGTAGSATGAAPGSTGAAGTSSNIGLTSSQLISGITSAAQSATALQVKGKMVAGGQSITLDLNLNQNSGSGSIAEGGTTIPVIAVGGVSYFQFTPGVISMIGQDPTSALMKPVVGKWVSSTGQLGASIGSSFGSFTSLSQFRTLLTTVTTGTAAYKGQATVDGQAVAVYASVDSSGSAPATTDIDIPLSGPALPVRINGTGPNAGTLDLVWNKPTVVTAPSPSQLYTGD